MLSAESYIPSLNLSETDSELQITMEVPGVNPEEVDIEVTGNTVRIRGEHKEEKEEKGRTYHRIDRRTGSFLRGRAALRSQTFATLPISSRRQATNFTSSALPASFPTKSPALNAKNGPIPMLLG